MLSIKSTINCPTIPCKLLPRSLWNRDPGGDAGDKKKAFFLSPASLFPFFSGVKFNWMKILPQELCNNATSKLFKRHPGQLAGRRDRGQRHTDPPGGGGALPGGDHGGRQRPNRPQLEY